MENLDPKSWVTHRSWEERHSAQLNFLIPKNRQTMLSQHLSIISIFLVLLNSKKWNERSLICSFTEPWASSCVVTMQGSQAGCRERSPHVATLSMSVPPQTWGMMRREAERRNSSSERAGQWAGFLHFLNWGGNWIISLSSPSSAIPKIVGPRILYSLKNYWRSQRAFAYVGSIYQYLPYYKLKLRNLKAMSF